MSRPVTEFGYGYLDWPDGSVAGPVPEWEARGRALCDHSVRVFSRTAGIDADWSETTSPGPDAIEAGEPIQVLRRTPADLDTYGTGDRG